MINYIASHYIEIVGSILSVIYLYLSIKQKVSLWIYGFLCSAFYIVVFFQSKFYADMSLQFYYLGVSVYGWFSWRDKEKQTGKELSVIKTGLNDALILLPVTLVILFVYYFILKNYTDSPLPFADSFTTALSITATWMLAKKMIEHWILWIIVDSVSAGLYFYKELYPTTILFVIYTIMAVVGWIQWRKNYYYEGH
ncbi:nicotinamide riboside transporter PnuC [Paludibacter sp.]